MGGIVKECSGRWEAGKGHGTACLYGGGVIVMVMVFQPLSLEESGAKNRPWPGVTITGSGGNADLDGPTARPLR